MVAAGVGQCGRLEGGGLGPWSSITLLSQVSPLMAQAHPDPELGPAGAPGDARRQINGSTCFSSQVSDESKCFHSLRKYLSGDGWKQRCA